MADGNAPNRIFLRTIIYRIDFQLITERMQEELFQYVAETYSAYFSNQGNEQENSVDIEVNPFTPDMPRMNTRMQNIFVLTRFRSDDCDGRTLRIGKTFVSLELELNITSMGISYYEWFSDIIAHMQGNRMFRPVRIGLRKFNSFYILDEHKQSLDAIFRIPFFKNANVDKFELDQTNTVQLYNTDDYALGFSRNYSSGNLSTADMEDQPAHLIAFDFDLYSTEQTVLDKVVQDPVKGLKSMNADIYRFFAHVVKDDIIERINNGDLLEELNVIPC